MELSHHGERREGSSHYQHTGDGIYILYNIQPFYGSPTFMAHYDYEWSLTPQRAKSCDTKWLLLDVLFFVYIPSHGEFCCEVLRVVRGG